MILKKFWINLTLQLLLLGVVYGNDDLMTDLKEESAPQLNEIIKGLRDDTKSVVQAVYDIETGVVQCADATVMDDSKPTSTEGTQVFSVTITPKSANNVLVFEGVAYVSLNDASNFVIASIIQDNDAEAIAAFAFGFGSMTQDLIFCLPIHFAMTAGTVEATTFKVRIGAPTGTVSVNGIDGSRYLGGVFTSSLIITEYSKD